MLLLTLVPPVVDASGLVSLLQTPLLQMMLLLARSACPFTSL